MAYRMEWLTGLNDGCHRSLSRRFPQPRKPLLARAVPVHLVEDAFIFPVPQSHTYKPRDIY